MTAVARGPSRTAVLTAAARALHREQPPPWVLDDPLAIDLAGDEGLALMQRMRRDLSHESLLDFTRWVCTRGRYVEDLVEVEAARGIGQYAILGAGLDSFGYRHRNLLERLRVFEVDQPESQAWKRRRLAEIGIAAPPNLTFAPIDFETQTLADGLAANGFDWSAPAVFSWIGVTMYLTRRAIDATLSAIVKGAPRSSLVLTYNLPMSELSALAAETSGAMRAIAAEMGEPFVSLFLPDDIESLLRSHGCSEITHFGPEEALHRYFPGRSDVQLGGAQRIAVARV